jgi:two-component system, OmpR family, alkaline phosphatase synthesis response regulator PhoP
MPKKAKVESKNWALIVEDDVFINKAYAAKFSHEGIPVKMAEDGEKAMQILKKGEIPALILLDLMLPNKSGFEVLEEIKQDPKLKKVPVLILTNLAQDMDVDRGMALGAKEYLVKADLKIEDLVGKVKKYLQDKK